ncbi:bacterio-opsin activator domain-containing protein [Haloarchaeobius sp. HME9146]|uniref:bacterio-opsin activator domain-containing protein n=1 Tax=Haloarchaeobius sp. HME9146 TaxID=2978732 RepID=UPI0021C1DD2F|nr:bacterio-opsin activator domain-containing protein [Haloarchaeobius sp. HME9146]MCT9096024.1 response regulator [Haloarchaeobius sp. HME9146]
MATELSAESDTQRSTPTVLVVDDDQDLADTCRYWLEGEGYRVRTAYGGEDALDVVDEEQVDLVLLDRRMPRLSGDEVLDELRERGHDCPVAMMTAVAPDTDIVDMPFDEYLVKPVAEEDVLDAAEELLARDSFSEDVREYFALEATESALSSRDEENLRDAGVLGDLRDELSEAYEDHEAEIERREQQLDRLVHVNRVIRSIDRTLVEASTRETIESEVCEALVRTESYCAAWIAEYNDHSRGIQTRSTAGGLTDNVDADPDGQLQECVAEAVESGKPQVVSSIAESHGEAVFEDTVEASETAAVVVPLAYREKSYGALLVYTVESHVFTDHELSVFVDLGDHIGNGINAVEQRKLLLADTIAELEFRHADTADPFVALSRDTGGTFTLRGVASTDEVGLTCFVEVEDADADEVLERAADHDAVDHVRLVTEGGESLFELSVTSAAIETLSDVGATVNTFRVEDGEGRIVAEVAPDADLKAIVAAVQSAFQEISVLSKREVERSVQSTEAFKQGLSDKLTDRQQTALETAYAAGYYEWPRDSTAEEVAEAMDIAAPTLHEHLRAGERKLLDAFVDETN